MNKMSKPDLCPEAVLEQCVEAVSDQAKRGSYISNWQALISGIDEYRNASARLSWFELSRCTRGNETQTVKGSLTKQALIDLYSKHMVGAKGMSREIYDEILVTANGKCPFCAGIGHTKTLDHYLPKAIFPLYAVIPANLVPCCKDCNVGKNSNFPREQNLQPLHPYFDDQKYFSERWVIASIDCAEPLTVSFHTRPPKHWGKDDALRVQTHFDSYSLAKRYSVEAGTEIPLICDLRNSLLGQLGPKNYRNHLLEVAECDSLPLNGWKRALYFALANCDQFTHNSASG